MTSWIPFACPNCHAALEETRPDELVCSADGLRFSRIDGIWHFLLPGRSEWFEKFVREYETVRKAEGRGVQDAAYYRALPYRDLSGKMPADWHIRAASFDLLKKQVISPPGRPLSIIDLGAGNGWLSNRLAGMGHNLLAIDLMTNDFDGLGCQSYFESAFMTAQAEFDHLPCPDQCFDLVVFNASLHYSVDMQATLAEALRVLGTGGQLVILDSPIYNDAESGRKMVQEREALFTRKYGFPSNSLKSKNFFTYSGLESLGRELEINWQYLTPFYGIRWALKPLTARIRGRREPARFHVIIGRINSNIEKR